MTIRDTYYPKGTCSKRFDITLTEGRIDTVRIIGGCDGNTHAIENLLAGMTVEDAIRRMKGIDCGGRGTSCPDQMALALEALMEKAQNRAG